MRNKTTEVNLVDSLLWDVLEKYLNEQIELIKVKLTTCELENVVSYQAMIKAYKQLLGLKDIIMEETRGQRTY